MKNVEVSDEAWERIMRDSKGASFDAMVWRLIMDCDEAKKSAGEIMRGVVAAVIAKDKDEFKKLTSKGGPME